MLKVNNRHNRKRREKHSKLTIKTPERRQWSCSGVFINNFVHILHLFLVFLLLTLNKEMSVGTVILLVNYHIMWIENFWPLVLIIRCWHICFPVGTCQFPKSTQKTIILLVGGKEKSLHQNKKALCPFYHKKYFW